MRIKHHLAFVLTAFGIAGVLGCQQSSHTVSHSYEYHEQGAAPVRESEVVHEPPPSEYRMTSPGEMSSPGEMASPGRMVVEPRRQP